ncbi:MAG: helix-turn-helix domain-containing protein [Actinomycetota bacterium]|jgi:transcriptional regulator with XRE-family HTH domain|nr:helix-turn-helix domain-containing protein [Actinomycetota bacterium]
MDTKRKVGYMMQGSLAERLRVLRAQRGLQLTEAAAKIGVDRHTLRRLERGVGEPRYPTLNKISRAYGVPVEELLEEPVPLAEAPEAGPTNQQDPLSPPSREVPEDGDGEGQRAVGIGRVGPETRIEVLEQGWISPVKKRNERWRAEIDGWRRQGTYPYGRADEMDAFARERILGRADEVGLIDHYQAVLGREKEVSAREFEACRVLNRELFVEAFDLVAEAYNVERELDQVRQGTEEGTVTRIPFHIDGGPNRTPSSAPDRIRRWGS